MNIDALSKQDFLDYSMEVIKDRAIPAIDGCKTIHRRILHHMKEEGYISSKPTRKCAKVVGGVLGMSHPHGSSSVYEALVRLSQSWKLRYPLIEIQGNNGSISGDPAAAERYTECRLSPIGELVVNGYNKECVSMELNYSGELYIPTLLPSAFPNLICNSNLGIAVAVASTTASHNLGETIDAINAYINNQNISIDDLIPIINAPDFPTGGTIVNPEIIPAIYKTGKGSIKLRSKYDIEEINGQKHIVIKEIPYLVTVKEKIIDKLKKLVIEEEYEGIETYQNNIGKDGFEIRIILSKGANLNKVLNTLFEKTGLQSSININNTLLIDGKPKLCNLKELIHEYYRHRSTVIIKASEYDKKKHELKYHINEGLIIAHANIDDIIAAIKSSPSRAAAKTKVMQFNLTEIQADAILDMKLSKLTSFEIDAIKRQQEELMIEIARLNCLIHNTDKKRDNYIIEELNSIKSKYNDSRRTVIAQNAAATVEEEVEAKTVLNLYSDGEYYSTSNWKEKVNLKKIKEINSKKPINFGVLLSNKQKYFLVDNLGNYVPYENSYEQDKTLYGADGIQVSALKFNKEYVIGITSNGTVKRSKTSDYNAAKGGKILKLKDGDILVACFDCNDDDYILMLGENGQLNKLSVTSVPLTSKLTIGSKGMSCKVKSAACGSDQDKVFMVSDNKIKTTQISEININPKGSGGQIIADNTTHIEVSDVVFILDDSMKITPINTSSVTTKSKTAGGATLGKSTIISVFGKI